MKAEVFTPGTSNFWREISISVQAKQYGSYKNQVYYKGKCLWLMLGDPWSILCFDVCKEVCHNIPLPNGQHLCSSLTIHDSVCFFWYPLLSASSNCIHMWKLDFNDNGGGGTKPFERLYIPSVFWQADELLLDDAATLELYYNPQNENDPEDDDELLMDTDTDNDRLLSYNIRTEKLRKIKLPDCGSLGPIYFTGPYVKSLVTIGEKKLA